MLYANNDELFFSSSMVSLAKEHDKIWRKSADVIIFLVNPFWIKLTTRRLNECLSISNQNFNLEHLIFNWKTSLLLEKNVIWFIFEERNSKRHENSIRTKSPFLIYEDGLGIKDNALFFITIFQRRSKPNLPAKKAHSCNVVVLIRTTLQNIKRCKFKVDALCCECLL